MNLVADGIYDGTADTTSEYEEPRATEAQQDEDAMFAKEFDILHGLRAHDGQ